MDKYVPRQAEALLQALLARNPAVILTGARQTGKSSLARKVASGRPSIVYDLEKEGDSDALRNHGAELRKHTDKLVVIDEIQHKPELFSELRVIIDELRANGRPHGKFLLLGSVSGRLQRQSEGLTGRVAQMQMHPLNWLEVAAEMSLRLLWGRGGHPESLLAEDDGRSLSWRQDYLGMTVQKDALSATSTRMTADHYQRLLALIAARQKEALNKSQLASELAISQETVTGMLANLEEMMLIRRLPAYAREIPRRTVKNPKYYICDSGLFHAIVCKEPGNLAGQAAAKVRGASWEGFVIENLLSVVPRHWHPFFFKTHKGGNEVDLLLEGPGGGLWAIEIRSGADATPDRRFLNPLQHLRPERSFMVHAGLSKPRASDDIQILSLADMMNELRAQEPLGRQETARTVLSPDDSFAEAMKSLTENGALLNLHRARFIDCLGQRFERILEKNPEPHEQDARNEWIDMRNQLLQWLNLETVLRPREESADWRQKLVEALEKLQGSIPDPLPPSRKVLQKHSFFGTFGRLCCHDLFVHVIAALMRNKCFSSVRELLSRKYYLRGQMLESICFWSGPPRDLEGLEGMYGLSPSGEWKRQTVGNFATTRPAETAASLMEAELVLVLHGMLAEDSRPAEQRALPDSELHLWLPWILNEHPGTPELPFFVRAENQEDVKNILACLGLRPEHDSIEKIRKIAVFQLNKLKAMPDNWDPDRIRRCLGLDKWHDLRPRQ